MNVNKLKGKIVESGKSIPQLADEIGVDKATLYRKLADIEKFTIGEACRIKDAINLSNEDACEVFL